MLLHLEESKIPQGSKIKINLKKHEEDVFS